MALRGPVLLGCLSATLQAHSGQQIPEFFNIFNGLINSAIVDAARREWQGRPLTEYNCLASHGVSADQFGRSRDRAARPACSADPQRVCGAG